MVCRNNLRTISTMYPLSTAHRISVTKSDRQYTKRLDLPQNAGQVSSCGLLSCRLRPRQFLDLFDTNKPKGRLITSQKFTPVLYLPVNFSITFPIFLNQNKEVPSIYQFNIIISVHSFRKY